MSGPTQPPDSSIRLARDSDTMQIASLLFDSFAEYADLYNPESFCGDCHHI